MIKNNLPNTSTSPHLQRTVAHNIVGNSVISAAYVSKLRAGNMPHHQQRSTSSVMNATTQANVARMSEEQQIRTIDNQNAIELMPEIEWASRVLISSMLSPKDMTKRELIYTMQIDWLPPDIRMNILDLVKEEIEKTYSYSDSLYVIFKDALFLKGSHPRLVLPEAAVDRIINGGHTLSMESIGNIFKDEKVKGSGYFGERRKDFKGSALNMESFKRSQESIAVDDRVPESAVEFEMTADSADGSTGQPVFTEMPLVTISDNVDSLKLPAYLDAIMQSQREDLLNRPSFDFGSDFDFDVDTDSQVTHEAFATRDSPSKNAKLTNSEFINTVYKAAPNNMVTHLRIPGVDALPRRSVGRPLVQSLPPESVIPIHVPGDVRRHLGYILILDETGHPITMNSSNSIINRAAGMVNSAGPTGAAGNGAMGSMILSKAARNLTSGRDVTSFAELTKIYEEIIEEDVVTRLKNGKYPGGAELSATSDVYSLMLARTLCSMRTRLVFVPSEMISYFAFDYHENGVGKSLLDNNKMLISMRAGLLLTRMTSEMRNSIPLTKVSIKIDEDDPDWEKTVEQSMDVVSQTRQPQFPLTSLAVNDICDWIHRGGMFFTFDGHPQMPGTGFEFEKLNHENTIPDSDLYDTLGKQLYLGFGIPPELMDTAYDPEFATALISRNIMFSQTVLENQKKASGLMTDDIRRLVLSDATILGDVVKFVKSKWGVISESIPTNEKQLYKDNPKNYAESLITRIINSTYVSLPSPDLTTLSNQMEALKQQEEALDAALPYWISENILSRDFGEELVGKLDSMLPAMKAAYMRDWMAKNGVMSELADMVSKDETGKPSFDLLNITRSHIEGLMINLMSFAKSVKPIEAAVKKDTEALGLSDDGGGSSSPMEGSSDSSGFDGFGDGGDDLDLGEPPTDEPSSDESDVVQDDSTVDDTPAEE